MNKIQFTTHEKLYEALIFSANEEQKKPIAGAYEILKEVWFFLNSDSATFNSKGIEKYKRPLLVNPVIVGKPNFDKFFEAEITYCSKQNNINITEQDFINDIKEWIKKRLENNNYSVVRQRKFKEFNNYLNDKEKHKVQPQQETKANAPTKKDFKQHGWFKVAVLFASGKMQKFYTVNSKNEFVIKPEYTAPKIAKDLKIPDYQKEILATLNNYKKGNSNAKKNIFNRTSTELKEVIKYCENKKYDLTPDFIERYNLIKDK